MILDWLLFIACMTGPIPQPDTGTSFNVLYDGETITLAPFAVGGERTRACVQCQCVACLSFFDWDGDTDVDLRDVAAMMR